MTPPALSRLVPGPVRRTVRAEWGPLAAAVRAGLVRRGPAALTVTTAAVCLIVLCQYLQNQPWGRDAIATAGYVQTSQPWWDSLLRTPLSLFVPAPDLPVWGGLLQVFVVFGVCECALGWRRTLLIAYAATLAGTTYARIGVALGPGGPLGLPASTADVHDTGPSAAVVGLSVYVCWRYRAWLTGALVVGSMLLEVHAKPNLAGREHLVAILAVLVVCAVSTRRERRRRLLPRTARGARGGAGPRLPRWVSHVPHPPRLQPRPPALRALRAALALRAARAGRPRAVPGPRAPGGDRGHDAGKPPSQSWALRRSRFHRAS